MYVYECSRRFGLCTEERWERKGDISVGKDEENLRRAQRERWKVDGRWLN